MLINFVYIDVDKWKNVANNVANSVSLLIAIKIKVYFDSIEMT